MREKAHSAARPAGARTQSNALTASWRSHPSLLPHSLRASELSAADSTHLEDALDGVGAPMPPSLQYDMGRRLGHDFSKVRIHTDAPAAQSAQGIGASAYTVGSDIVFGPDMYRPSSPEGQELVAHELGHVIEQEAHANILQGDFTRNKGSAAPVATLTPDQVQAAVTFNQGLFQLPQSLALIRDLLGVPSMPAASDEVLVRAVARWQARKNLPQSGQLDPATIESLKAELQAEQAEMLQWSKAKPALTSTPPDPTAGPSSVAALPKATRQRLQVVTATVTIPPSVIDDFFAQPGQGQVRTTHQSGFPESFGPGIPDVAKKVLSSLAGYLLTFDARKPDGTTTKALGTDSTIQLEISLRPHIEFAGLFRFSRVADTSKNPGPDRLIIELVREVPPMNSAQLEVEPAFTGTFAVGGVNFTAGAGWRQDTSALLRKALTLLPSAALNAASGLTFVQRGPGTAAEAGNYDQEKDTVTIHNNAFERSSVRQGEVPTPVSVILHEIGHALDLRPLEAAFKAANAAGTQAAFNALPSKRSPSGSHWESPGANQDFVRKGEKGKVVDTDFRKAAQADGFRVDSQSKMTGGVTEYGNTNWEEAFAEAFALYMTNPTLMKSLRPKTHDYFAGRYPR